MFTILTYMPNLAALGVQSKKLGKKQSFSFFSIISTCLFPLEVDRVMIFAVFPCLIQELVYLAVLECYLQHASLESNVMTWASHVPTFKHFW